MFAGRGKRAKQKRVIKLRLQNLKVQKQKGKGRLKRGGRSQKTGFIVTKS